MAERRMLLANKIGDNPPNNEIWYWTNNNKIIEPYKIEGFGANLISNEYTNKGILKFDDIITEIPDHAFQDVDAIIKIIIPNSIYIIGSNSIPNNIYAFSDNINVDYGNIILNYIVEVKSRAFFLTNYTYNVYIGHNIENIGERCFSVSNIHTVKIDNHKLTYLPIGCFSACYYLYKINIPNNITRLENEVFINCVNLPNILLHNNINYIGRRCFGGCKKLTSIDYTGTINEWENIEKGLEWNLNSSITTIHCTDGDIQL